jgi:acyl dehydratase
MQTQYWEDFAPGWTDEIGPRAITAAEIVALAGADAAERTAPASAAIACRMMTDGRLRQASMLGSTMIQRLALRRPVRPGDLLTLRTVVTAVAPMQDRSDRGVVEARYELRNESGAVVLEIDSLSVLQRRPPPRQRMRHS